MTFKKGERQPWKEGHWRDRINGRKFGLKYGRKGGKARWASMTQEEKDLVNARRDYAYEQSRRMKAKLSKTNLTSPKTVALSAQDIKDVEEFFGDIL